MTAAYVFRVFLVSQFSKPFFLSHNSSTNLQGKDQCTFSDVYKRASAY